jgi:hypothetical protein
LQPFSPVLNSLIPIFVLFKPQNRGKSSDSWGFFALIAELFALAVHLRYNAETFCYSLDALRRPQLRGKDTPSYEVLSPTIGAPICLSNQLKIDSALKCKDIFAAPESTCLNFVDSDFLQTVPQNILLKAFLLGIILACSSSNAEFLPNICGVRFYSFKRDDIYQVSLEPGEMGAYIE